MIRKFLADRRGVTSADWVVLTAMVVIAGVGVAYFMLGPDGGVTGLIDVFNQEVNQSSSNITGVGGSGGDPAPPSGAATNPSGGDGLDSGSGGGGAITIPDSPRG